MRRNVRISLLAAVVAGYAVVLALLHDGTTATAVDDLGTLATAVVAATAATWRAYRLRGRPATSWRLLAAALWSSAIGESIWSWYELVLHRDSPTPSAADVFYLLMPFFALAGLLVRPSAAFSGTGRWRAAFDGLIVTLSLFTISWVTALGATFRAGSDTTAAAIIAIAYPAADVVVLTVAIVIAAHARVRSGLPLLIGGLACMAVSDSAYTYFSSIGSYASGNLFDVGYAASYLLLAEAALRDVTFDRPVAERASTSMEMLSPYVPASIGLGLAVWQQVHPGLASNPTLVAATLLVVLLMLRQLFTLFDNRRLVQRVLDQQGELRHQAFHDPLTGLANRALFLDRLTHAVALHSRDMRSAAVLLADLDDFKTVNDSLGHLAGDDLLLRIAERLRAVTRTGDTVARLGGDEFAVLVEDGGEPLELAERVLEAFDQPVSVAHRHMLVRASIGVAALDAADSSCDAVDLLRRADVAMYAAKRAGKNTAVLYSAQLASGTNEIDMRAQLVTDLAAGRMGMHLQPVVDREGSVIAVEALARWSMGGRRVPPAEFIPVAERAGILPVLDEVLLRSAVAAVATFPRDISVAVNVDMGLLARKDLPTLVQDVLAGSSLRPDQLILEIPETTLLADASIAADVLGRLRSIGVRLALDDFGVGYSSLSRLQALPPDIVKLDRSFVAPLAVPDASTTVVAAIVDLAHRVGAQVVAEGVEQPQQLAVLRALGCDAFQGFLTGRPMPAAAARAFAAGREAPAQGRR